MQRCGFTQPEAVEAAIDKNTAVLFFETPSNPNLAIIDIKQIVKIAKDHNVKVVVDNTFATPPYFQRPLSYGVDVVVHSATKYICGHGDALGGNSSIKGCGLHTKVEIRLYVRIR